MLSSGACASTSPINEDAHYGGVGWNTPAGIDVRHATCFYEPNRMTAAGSLHLTGAESPAAAAINVTLFVPLLTTGSVQKTIDYPSPASTGQDVPFVLSVDTGTKRGGTCELEVAWAG